jgi:FkbM family methyltransferase
MLNRLVRHFLVKSYRSALKLPPVAPSDEDTIRRFAAYAGPGTPGFVTDFLGCRTRVAFVRAAARLDGTVEGYPLPGNFHATACEWAAALRAVLEAAPRGRLVVVEVGAGWGPWLVACHAAAARLGIAKVELVALEGSAGHQEFLRQHLLDNGIDPSRHRLIHGVAAVRDGEAEFPEVADPGQDYGASVAAPNRFLPRAASRSHSKLRAYSLATLVEPYPAVDLLHIDVQGIEGELIAASLEALAAKVRRVVIGTHGRDIEHRLLTDLSAHGWVLESDESCRYRQARGAVTLWLDGCQAWRNATL